MIRYILAGWLMLFPACSLLAAPPPPPPFGSVGAPLAGVINAVDGQHIVVMDMSFRFSPTVKVFSAKGKRIPLKQLHPGDIVGLKVLRIGNKSLVDSIQLVDMK